MKTYLLLLPVAVAISFANSAAFAANPSGLISLTHDGKAATVFDTPSGRVAFDCLTDLASTHAISGDGKRRVYIRHCLSPDGESARSFLQVQDIAHSTMKTVGASSDTIFQTSASISDDGRWIAYSAEHAPTGDTAIYLAEIQDWTDDEASSAVRDVYPIDTSLHTGDAVTVSQMQFVSADGSFVVFQSSSGNNVFAQSDSHIYRYERATDTLLRVDENADGAAWSASICADGSRIAFTTDATNLVARDTNGWSDIILWDTRPPLTKPRFIRASQSAATPDGGAHGPSDEPQLSANGEFVVYSSLAHDIAPLFSGVLFLQQNVFMYAIASGESYLVNSPESVACKDTPGMQRSAGTWPMCLTNGGTLASWSPVVSSDGRYIAFITTLPSLISTWDDGFGEWLTGETKPAGWQPEIQPRVMLRDMAEGRFYVQSARAIHDDALSRDIPGWYTTARGESSCMSMYGKPPLGLSLSADGQSTLLQVADEASHCAMQSASFDSYRLPDPDKKQSIFLKTGKGARSNTDSFP